MSKLKLLLASKGLEKDQKDLIRRIESSFKSETKTGEIKKTGFSASTLFYGPGMCPRRWSLLFRGVAESDDEWAFYNRRAAHAGTAAHGHLQEMILLSNPTAVVEEEFKSTDPTMRGYIDVYFPDENVPMEIKTCNSRTFDIRREKLTPADYQLRQLLVYMKIKNAKLGLMMYESRDTFETLIIPIVMTPERQTYIDNVFDWMREVEKTKESGLAKVFPGKRSNSRICSDCSIRKTCEGSEEGVVELPLLSKYTEAHE